MSATPKSSPGFLSNAELARSSAVLTSSKEEAPWPPLSDMPWSPQRTSRLGARASLSCKAKGPFQRHDAGNTYSLRNPHQVLAVTSSCFLT